jgi:CHAT domain-containing protein
MTKVESLRHARLDMIRGKVTAQLLAQRGVGGIGKIGQSPAARSLSQTSISTSHPYFWAPFILIGDGK